MAPVNSSSVAASTDRISGEIWISQWELQSENVGFIRSLGFYQTLLPAGWGYRPDPNLLSGVGRDSPGDPKAEPALTV